MARFRLMTPIAGSPPNYPYQRFKTGTTVADTVGNAQPGCCLAPALWLADARGDGPVGQRRSDFDVEHADLPCG